MRSFYFIILGNWTNQATTTSPKLAFCAETWTISPIQSINHSIKQRLEICTLRLESNNLFNIMVPTGL